MGANINALLDFFSVLFAFFSQSISARGSDAVSHMEVLAHALEAFGWAFSVCEIELLWNKDFVQTHQMGWSPRDHDLFQKRE